MNISGIVVQSASGRLEAVIDSLTSIDGVDVHQVDTQSSRLVATIEAANTGSEVATLRAIKSLPHVVYAELVYHRFDEESPVINANPSDLDTETGFDSRAVPAALND
ncbi:MAG: chaperone NapD [Chromatiales bacterium]|nr:chaperone NapD [Chromatiales bacterium]